MDLKELLLGEVIGQLEFHIYWEMLKKTPNAFRTISEVAAELELPQHVLRFWESKFDQIKPMKRGGGRRYYRPEDIEILKKIKALLYEEGYTIKGVQKLLKSSRGKIGSRSSSDGSSTKKTRKIDSERFKLEEFQDVLEELKEIRNLV